MGTSVRHQNAQKKGKEAREANKPRSACPYRDVRNSRGSITGARGYLKAWQRGWDTADREITGTVKQ